MVIARSSAPGLRAAMSLLAGFQSRRWQEQAQARGGPLYSYPGLHNHVVLARVGPVTLVNFGLIAAVGGALATWIALARQQQAGLHPEGYAALLFGVVPLLAVVGSRAFSLALDWRAFVSAPMTEALKPGFAFQGGLAGAVAGVVGVATYAGVDILMLTDAMALGFPLGHAIGRLACHTYGCCHGRPTRSRLAIRYTNPDSKAVWRSGLFDVPLHPTQIYSALGNLVLFVILTAIAFRGARSGEITATYLVVGSTGRFRNEFLRGVPTSRLLGMTPYQWVSIALFACGLGLSHLVSGNPAHERFADASLLFESLGDAAFSIYPLWVFVVIFFCFGIHGRQVGSFGSRGTRHQRTPH